MHQTRSTILCTPLEICQVAKEVFYSAEATVDVNADGMVTLKLQLSLNQPTITLNCAIDTTVFVGQLNCMKRQIELDRIGGSARRFSFNVDQCTVRHPLIDWQKFRRTTYEADGHSCVQVLSAYLQQPQQHAGLLHSLGLAPDQIEAHCTEADMGYFRTFCATLHKQNETQRATSFAAFQRYYPQVAGRILDEQIAHNHAQHSGQGNFRKEALKTLKGGVVGQDRAAKRMATVLASQQNQKGNSVFLFVGPTGVGKTELAKAVSKLKDNRFVMFAMNQYQHQTDISKLFGSAAGYVGSTDKPHFAKEIDRFEPKLIKTEGSKKFYAASNLVLLFDEFEKAHSQVKQSLLTLFDEGHCVMNYTEHSYNICLQYDFERCVIISTSNLYQQVITAAFQNNTEYNQIVEIFKQCNTSQIGGNNFSPELLGRMSVVPFGPIPSGECYQRLIQVKFAAFRSDLKKELSCREIEIEHESLILQALENQLYGDGTDIRKFRDYFDAIKGIIYSRFQGGHWQTQKIVFSCHNGVPCIRLSTYVEQFSTYREQAHAPPLPFPQF